MASLIKRKNAPFWFLKYKNEDGKWVQKSTGLRVDSERDSAKAEILRAEAAEAEFNFNAPASPAVDAWGWVDGWLVDHCQNPLTLLSYKGQWKHISHFLAVKRIFTPADVRFAHGAEYVEWRTGRRAGHKTAGRNTAIHEAKLLGLTMRHAVKLGLAVANPIVDLGIKKIPPKEKREFTDEEIAKCLAALDTEDEWLRLTFLIALHTGCRLTETVLYMPFVDFARRTITFGDPKGGKKKAFTRPLPAVLIPVLEPLKEREYSHSLPFQPSRQLQHFFQRVEIKGVSLHCLRVSYATRLFRAKVPLVAAMRLLNHGSDVVHRIYQKLKVEDVAEYADVLLYPPAPKPA